MNAVGSYVDPTVGALTLYMTIPAQDLAAIRRDVTQHTAGAVGRVAKYVWERNPGVLAHEWAHILQTATSPLLHLRAARQGRMLPHLLNSITELPEGTELPVLAHLHEDWHWASLLEAIPARLTPTDVGIAMSAGTDLQPRRGMLRELDLVEEDATVFQYRVEVGSRGTGPGYRQWLTEKPRYSALFAFLADLFGDDDHALQLIPVICRVCFATTRPLESLGAVLTDVIRDGSDVYTQEFPDPDWDEWAESFFRDRLLDRFGPASDESVDMRATALGDTSGVITDDAHAELVTRTPHLAVSLLAGWNSDDGDLLDDVLRHPWMFIERRGQGWDSRLERYVPPVMSYRFVAEDDSDSLVLVAPSAAMRSTPAPAAFTDVQPGLKMTALLLEGLRGRALVTSALGVRIPLAECPHAGCRFHSTGLCRGWVPVPETPEACDFPVFLSATTRRTVSSDGRFLISDKEAP